MVLATQQDSLGSSNQAPKNCTSRVARTIRLDYAIQFTRTPPRFRRVRYSMVSGNAQIMRMGIATLLAKGAIETVPPAEMKSGLYSPYFIVPKNPVGYNLSWTCAS